MEKAIRMPRKNEEWIKQAECPGEMRNGNGKQNAKEEWGMEKMGRMLRRNVE